MSMISIFILGAGGHAKVLIDTLHQNIINNILGVLDTNNQSIGQFLLSVPVLGCEDEILKNFPPSNVMLVNGVGSVGLSTRRRVIFEKFKNSGYQFLTVQHPTAYIGAEVIVGEGVQIMAKSTIQTGCYIGSNVIVNTHTSIDHDCYIGDHVHLAPGVTCCGEVSIGAGTHVGCGAILRQGVKIGENCLIAAGALVINDIPAGDKVLGIPARKRE